MLQQTTNKSAAVPLSVHGVAGGTIRLMYDGDKQATRSSGGMTKDEGTGENIPECMKEKKIIS